MGCQLECKLFKDAPDKIFESLFSKEIITEEERKKIYKDYGLNNRWISPNVSIVKTSTNIKLTWNLSSLEYSGNKLKLIVICKDKWIGDSSKHIQDYTVIVSVKHSELDTLYEQIRERITIPVPVRVRERR